MIEKICEKCGKKVAGYTEKHANHLLNMHKLKHKNQKEDNKNG